MKHLTRSCGVSYVPRRAKVVDVLAVRQVKQGTETTRFRTGSICSYASLLIYILTYSRFSVTSLKTVTSQILPFWTVSANRRVS